jgi:hypothetical protein
MKDAILIQQASGEHGAMLWLTMARHRLYAERHGMDYVAYFGEAQPEWWHPVWSRAMLCLDELARGREFVFCVDADAVIVDEGADLREALAFSVEGRGVIGLVEHPGPPRHLNCGVMLWRNGEKAIALLMEMIRLGPGWPPWYEQAILNEVVQRPEFEGVVQHLSDRWNSTYQVNEASEPIIMAWHGGWPVGMKLEWMRECLAGMAWRVASGGGAGLTEEVVLEWEIRGGEYEEAGDICE